MHERWLIVLLMLTLLPQGQAEQAELPVSLIPEQENRFDYQVYDQLRFLYLQAQNVSIEKIGHEPILLSGNDTEYTLYDTEVYPHVLDNRAFVTYHSSNPIGTFGDHLNVYDVQTGYNRTIAVSTELVLQHYADQLAILSSNGTLSVYNVTSTILSSVDLGLSFHYYTQILMLQSYLLIDPADEDRFIQVNLNTFETSWVEIPTYNEMLRDGDVLYWTEFGRIHHWDLNTNIVENVTLPTMYLLGYSEPVLPHLDQVVDNMLLLSVDIHFASFNWTSKEFQFYSLFPDTGYNHGVNMTYLDTEFANYVDNSVSSYLYNASHLLLNYYVIYGYYQSALLNLVDHTLTLSHTTFVHTGEVLRQFDTQLLMMTGDHFLLFDLPTLSIPWVKSIDGYLSQGYFLRWSDVLVLDLYKLNLKVMLIENTFYVYDREEFLYAITTRHDNTIKLATTDGEIIYFVENDPYIDHQVVYNLELQLSSYPWMLFTLESTYSSHSSTIEVRDGIVYVYSVYGNLETYSLFSQTSYHGPIGPMRLLDIGNLDYLYYDHNLERVILGDNPVSLAPVFEWVNASWFYEVYDTDIYSYNIGTVEGEFIDDTKALIEIDVSLAAYINGSWRGGDRIVVYAIADSTTGTLSPISDYGLERDAYIISEKIVVSYDHEYLIVLSNGFEYLSSDVFELQLYKQQDGVYQLEESTMIDGYSLAGLADPMVTPFGIHFVGYSRYFVFNHLFEPVDDTPPLMKVTYEIEKGTMSEVNIMATVIDDSRIEDVYIISYYDEYSNGSENMMYLSTYQWVLYLYAEGSFLNCSVVAVDEYGNTQVYPLYIEFSRTTAIYNSTTVTPSTTTTTPLTTLPPKYSTPEQRTEEAFLPLVVPVFPVFLIVLYRRRITKKSCKIEVNSIKLY
ncbi:MAG: hypothetical protein INQ03_10540 [Candidatus Heimdallarchaeota archaeon]|nr:hypothetical protein [Candidatus Heimdallarchaeota archaeon]